MKLFFIVQISIFYVLQALDYNYVAVPVTCIIGSRGREFFNFQGSIYTTRAGLTDVVKRRFPDVPPNCLLVHVVSIRRGNVVNITRINERYLKVDSTDPILFINVRAPNDIIRLVRVEHKYVYQCNDGFFDSYMSANTCINDIKKYDKFRLQHKIIGKDSNSKIIWTSIWNNCYYRCFSKIHYQELGLRVSQYFFFNNFKLFLELNKYRNLFEKNSLKLSYSLHTSAQKIAQKISNLEKYFNIPQNIIYNFVSAPMANIQMNKWYLELISSKQKAIIHTKKLKVLEDLFTKTIRKVGFGVVKTGKYIIIVCMYK